MFQSAIINMFIPMGNETTPNTVIDNIRTHSSKQSTGELIVRVFEYCDVNTLIPITLIGDIIVVNPDVFPCGRHFTDEQSYKKMVRKTLCKVKCDILDIGSRNRTECKDALVGKRRIFWYAGPSESQFINGACAYLFNDAKSRGAPVNIPPDIATHFGTACIKFVSDDPTAGACPRTIESTQSSLPVINPSQHEFGESSMCDDGSVGLALDADSLNASFMAEMKLIPSVNLDTLRKSPVNPGVSSSRNSPETHWYSDWYAKK